MKKFDNFASHLEVLERSGEQNLDNEFIVSGIIDKFRIQFELGWKLLKELLRHEGVAAGLTGSPRDILKAAYSCFQFIDEPLWLSMLRDRNDTTHIYDEAAARALVRKIIDDYAPEFARLRDAVRAKYGAELESMK